MRRSREWRHNSYRIRTLPWRNSAPALLRSLCEEARRLRTHGQRSAGEQTERQRALTMYCIGGRGGPLTVLLGLFILVVILALRALLYLTVGVLIALIWTGRALYRW